MTNTDRQQRIKRQRKRRVAKGTLDTQPYTDYRYAPTWIFSWLANSPDVDAMKKFTDQLDRIIPDYQKNGWVHC